MKEKKQKQNSSKQQNLDIKKHLTPVDDEKLEVSYINALGDILENNDKDARDNLADYMDEIKQESDALETTPGDDLSEEKGKIF